MKKHILLLILPLLLFLLCSCGETTAPLPRHRQHRSLSLAQPPTAQPTPTPAPASGSDIPRQETAEVGPSPVFPTSEHIPNYEPMVTGSADTLEKIIVWDYTANVSGKLSDEDALACFAFLIDQETVGVPDPQHWDNPTTMLDAKYGVELYYTDGSYDTVCTHSEGGGPYRFYRSFSTPGTNGDPGYVYFQDDGSLHDMIKKSCEN